MKKKLKFKVGRTLVLLNLLNVFCGYSYGQSKFVGNIHSYYNDTNFVNYWNQVTPENAGKWSKCEPNRDQYDWSYLDQAYEFAEERGIAFKQHTFVWGNQYPKWMDDLSEEEQRAEVEEWIKDFGERYPDCEFIDVVNEPLPGHGPAPFRNALGGDGETGWDWVVTSFEWAREYCPNSKLLLNDFGIINDTWSAGELAKIANILKARDLIDGIGLQCHAFSMNSVSLTSMNEVLTILSETGLPIYIAELDMGGEESLQLNRYKEKFSLLYNHENVKGITLWGYRKDHMWIPDAWLYNEDTGYEREALIWMQDFLIENEQGHIVPGRVEAEDYYRHSGIDTINVNDSTIVVDQIKSKDWVNYVIDVLGEEEYQLNMKVSNIVSNSNIYILVDDKVTDTINTAEASDTLSASIVLSKGKHTLKFLFDNSSVETNLLELDWIDIYGETTYHAVTAAAKQNGNISPEGLVYVPEGDSVVFHLDADVGFKPDSIMVDGVNQKLTSSSFTLRNVVENHTISSSFTECNSTELTPQYKINSSEFEDGTSVTLFEIDTLTLKVDYLEQGTNYWLNPAKEQHPQDELLIESIQMSEKGTYGFYHVNEIGCKSNINFNVEINRIELNVYEAEDYIKQSGIQTEEANDVGGGENIGYIENNDWCTYKVNIDTPGIYEFIARAATGTNGGNIEISLGEEKLGSLPIKGSQSEGWQDWFTSDPVSIKFENMGEQEVKLSYKGGSGYLFNLNWFDLEFKQALSNNNENENLQVKIYPNPAKDVLNFDLTGRETSIELYTVDGKQVLATKTKDSKFSINTTSLKNAVYFVKMSSAKQSITRKIIIR